ncbi:DUF1843 domain-containing protein [Chitinivorax sp. B]|uniref:DUF1843 domain-containing protein n=1 Tax=Chitinivorax sp. B TaxID=2502235 RepID=UPI0010F82F25|nr:DUF1843 domain-containing protein [Chitinivorax sp. B]
MTKSTSHTMPPYGNAIHQAIASGDLSQMKALLQQGEQHLQQYDDLHKAVEQLKLEITRLEKR